MEKEIQDARAYAATGFARDILSIADNLGRALAAIPEELREDEKVKGIVIGVEATGKELERVFRKHGIEKVETLGQPLDPNSHQAMFEMPSDTEHGTIVTALHAGHMIHRKRTRMNYSHKCEPR